MEQRVNLKFIVKLGKKPAECFQLLQNVYGADGMSRARAFKWHKHFKSDREEVENDSKPGQPSTSKTAENIELTPWYAEIDD